MDQPLARKLLDDGRAVEVLPLLEGRARLCVTDRTSSSFYDDVW